VPVGGHQRQASFCEKKGKEGKPSAFCDILIWANSGPLALNYLYLKRV
jgi:hypothetical protein